MIKTWVEKTKLGDKEAYCSLVEAFYDSMFLLSTSILKNAHDADDVCQESFVIAYKKIRSLKDPSAFKSWLSKIVWNRSKDAYNKRKKDPELVEQMQDVEALDDYVSNHTEIKMDLFTALMKIKPIYREVLVLRYLQDMQIKDVAKLTKTSQNTVKSRLRYALEQMKRQMGGYQVDEK